VQVRLIDVVAVGTPDGWVPVTGPRAQRLLAALAVASGPVPAERLADQLWESGPPPTWRVALRGLVAQLRETAGDPALVVTGASGLHLGDSVETDLRGLADDVAEAGRLVEQGRDRSAVELLGPAVGVRGERLLSGVDAAWLAAARAELDDLGLRAAEHVVAAHARLGNHAEAVSLAQQLVAADPLVERTHRTLLRALAAAADRGAAVRAFDRCRTLLADELGVDPSDETVAIYLEAIGGTDPAGVASVPAPIGSFVGRDRELAVLADALGRPGLVTITGRGGVGKSRLAAEATRARSRDGGSSWVSLATLADDPLVDATVALRLGITTPAEDQAAALVAELATRGRTLLVLDGCDAVPDGVATLVAALLERVPHLSVLVTSRKPLGLDAEHLLDLDPLGLPDGADADSVHASAAGRLLAQRVQERGGRLALDTEHAAAVQALCRCCAGLPLALELVAAQLAGLPPGDLLDHLEDVGTRGEDALRQVAEGSLALLAPDEEAVFRRLSVLDGLSSLTMIRAVVADDPVAPVRVVRVLASLESQGLVNVRRGGPRLLYELEDDLRRVAAARLAATGESAPTYRRLADAVRGLLPDDPSTPPAGYASSVTVALDSVRSLLAAGIDGRADRDAVLEIAFRLHRYWAATSIGEGRFWLGRLLADGGEGPWTAYAQYALGYLSYWAGDSEAAVGDLEGALPWLTERDPAYAVRAMAFRAGVLDDLDRGAEAADQMRAALDAAHAAPDADTPAGIAIRVSVAMNLGALLAERGDRAGVALVADAVERCERDSTAQQLALILPLAARVCSDLHAVPEAKAHLDQAWPLLADQHTIAYVDLLTAAAAVALAEGDLAAAVDHGRTAHREAIELGMQRNLPRIGALLTAALLGQGRVAEAAEAAADALKQARDLGMSYPVADALEAVASVVEHTGGAPGDLAVLMGASAGLREGPAAGARPAHRNRRRTAGSRGGSRARPRRRGTGHSGGPRPAAAPLGGPGPACPGLGPGHLGGDALRGPALVAGGVPPVEPSVEQLACLVEPVRAHQGGDAGLLDELALRVRAAQPPARTRE